MVGETSIKKRFSLKVFLKIFIFLLIIAVIAAGGLYTYRTLKAKNKAKTTIAPQTAFVMRGNIGVSISGSGYITSSNRVDVTPAVSGTIMKVNHREGDQVKAGDVLFEIDNTKAKANIEDIENNISQSELSQSSANNDLSKLIIKAPFQGKVTGVAINVGDVLNKGTTLCTISDPSRMKLIVPFNSESIKSIKIGMQANINLQDIMESVSGIVTNVSKFSFNSTTGELYNVEITVNNPGALTAGMKASADISTADGIISSSDTASLALFNNQVLKTETGGTVKAINIVENQNVNTGDILIEFENNDMVVANKSYELKMDNLNKQLEDAKESLKDYIIKAPIDGEITSQSIVVGNNVNSGTVISSIANTKEMEFEIPVDELDIAKVKVGQSATITVDALPDTTTRPLTGKVSKIAIEGTSSNGVTTYPVTIKVDQTENLKGGMNVNADISISQKNDVLYVPIAAVQKFGNRAMVMVKSDGAVNSGQFNNGQFRQFGNRQWQQGGQTNPNTGTDGNSGIKTNEKQNDSNSKNNNDNSNNERKFNGNQNPNNNQNSNSSQNGNASSGNYNRSGRYQGGNGNTNANTNGNTNGYARNGAGSTGGTANSRRQGMASALSNNPYYKDSVPRMVETGINNENYIEIVSGLNEGEEIMLPPVVAAKTNAQASVGGFGGFGGMGGGAIRSFSGGNANIQRNNNSNQNRNFSGNQSGSNQKSRQGD